MRFKNSRGGVKPLMIPNSNQLSFTMPNGNQKFGYYELSRDGLYLARRVELPLWLSELTDDLYKNKTTLLSQLKLDKVRMRHTQGESKGHILLDSLKLTKQRFPCVGVDKEILSKLVSPPIQLKFYVYGAEYKLKEVWGVEWQQFTLLSNYIATDRLFTPQYMIPVTHLREI